MAAGLLLGGCGRRQVSIPRPPAEPAYVSLDRLARQHPLWDDLLRLEGAARRLEGIRAVRGPSGQAAPAGSYALSELRLLPVPQGNLGAPLTQLREKGEAERVQLARRLQRLRDREIERRRGDLEAGSEREQARRARELLAGIDISSRFRQILAQISDDPANAVLKKVAPAPSTQELLGPEDREPLDRYAMAVASVRAWISALEASLNLGLIPETRTIIEGRLARARATLTELQALEQQARQQAEREAAAVIEQAARQDRARIDREIAALRVRYGAEIAERVQRERMRLEDDLVMVQRLSRTLKTVPTDEASARAYAVPVPARGPGGSGGPAAQAAGRIREQRDRLWRFLRADVRTAVRDVASARNIQVSFNMDKQGVPDRTTEFARWIGYERSQGTGERKR